MNENTIGTTATLVDAIRALEISAKRLAVVISENNNEVLGTLTDGDIRRCILSGFTLQMSVVDAMNSNPVTANVNVSDGELRELMRKHNIRSLPLVDGKNHYVRTLHETDLLAAGDDFVNERTFAAAVIMAGGEGTRLRPLTENLPKPMVEINGTPLLERQIRGLSKMGIGLIYISVNYLSDIIKDYFGDGNEFGVEVHYLHEDKKLGTAGALSLLPEMETTKPLLVMNGDILTTSDFIHLYHFHNEHRSTVTVSAINYHVEIPYGVIQCDGPRVIRLQEKPSQSFFCNAGIYAISVDILKKIPADAFWNMTDLIEQCLAEGESVSVFPVHEYWTDIGTPADLERARNDSVQWRAK